MTVPPSPASEQNALSFGELWSIQESLLQSYRQIFITVESVLFALATFALAGEHASVLTGGPIIGLGLGLLPIWLGVCRARARAVTYVHLLIRRFERGEAVGQPYTRFREFQEKKEYRSQVLNDAEFKDLSESTTRKRIDRDIPLWFAVMWIVLAVVLLKPAT